MTRNGVIVRSPSSKRGGGNCCLTALRHLAKHSDSASVIMKIDALATLKGGGREDLESYTARMLTAFKNELPHFRSLPPEYDIKGDILRELSFVWGETGEHLNQSIIFSHHRPPSVHCLILTCPTDGIEQEKPGFVEILSNIRFLNLP